LKRRHVVIFGIAAIAAPLIASWLAGEKPPPPEPAGTQVVIQWLDDSPPEVGSKAEPLLDLLYERSDNLYVVDSFDLGSGTMNVFLYSSNPDAAVRRVIELFQEGVLPEGMRIGVANSQGGDPAQRTYRPVYPDGLQNFQLIYAAKPRR
jgi:hypothetical protein